jgi:hypothetical protein
MASLYEQAYRAAMADSSIGKPLATAEGLGNLADTIRQSLEDKRKQKGDYGKEMQKILDNDGALSNADKEHARELVSGDLYDQYVNGDNAQQKRALNQLSNMQKQYGDYTEIMYDLASAERYGALSNSFLDSEKGKQILSLSDPSEYRLEMMENGEDMGVRLNDYDLISETQSNIANIENEIVDLEALISEGSDVDQSTLDSLYTQRDELQNLLNAGPTKLYNLQEFKSMIMKKDTDSRDKLLQAARMQYQTGYNNSPQDNMAFNYDKNYDFVYNTLIHNGNFDSLLTDEIIPGRIFKNDFIRMVQGKTNSAGTTVQGTTYGDLGITPEMLEGADRNVDDEIDEDEATNIYNALVGNSEMAKQFASNYFVRFLENNYNQGSNDRRPSNNNNEENKKENNEENNREINIDQI